MVVDAIAKGCSDCFGFDLIVVSGGDVMEEMGGKLLEVVAQLVGVCTWLYIIERLG
jgi:hypothetical protein